MDDEKFIVEWKLTNPDDESFQWRSEVFEYKWKAENFIKTMHQYAKALHIEIGFKLIHQKQSKIN